MHLPVALGWHQSQPPGKSEKASAPATVERYFRYVLQTQAGSGRALAARRILGIDEHFFSRKHGFATTFCDLGNHKIYDVVLGRIRLAP